MIDALRRMFEGRSPSSPAASPEEREHDLRLATAALLFEVVRADGQVDDDEVVVMRAAIRGTFDLPADEIDEVVRHAQDASLRAISLYEFTQVVDAAFSADEKKRIVELLWLVAFADSRKDPLEEYMIRKVAGLLHVAHPDFIDAKQRARSSAGR
jgi:uncharacterized tellurite resistance protein B-like protein